jgi:hypothetical protein
MLELLIRLQEMRACCARAQRNPQRTRREKARAGTHKQIVRECLPPEVLAQYDRLKRQERALLACPEVFAIAVLVATYRGLPPRQRRKLVAHFAPPATLPIKQPRQDGKTPGRGRTARRAHAAHGQPSGEPWPR